MPRTSDSHVTYLLRNPKSKETTPINCIVRFDSKRVNSGTGHRVAPINWNDRKQRIKNVLDVVDRDSINYFLDNLEDVINKFIKDCKANRIPLTNELVRKQIDDHLHPTIETEKPKTLLDFVKYYIETCPTRLAKGSKAKAGRFISVDTIRRFKTTFNGLDAFAKVYPRSLEFDNIDKEFYNAFVTWLVAKGYATNNVSKYIENLKGFMAVAVEEKFTNNLDFRQFTNLREDAENIYLTLNELNRIYTLDLAKHPRLVPIRDLFIFAANTGLRFSDFSSIQQASIKINERGKKYLDIKQRKTGGRLNIPLVNHVVVEILNKYNDKLPKCVSNQKTNDYLKEICEMAEINDIILKHSTKGGKAVIKTVDGWATTSSGVEKWRLVTTHTARRSFATNMFKAGVSVQYIMRLTGHKKESEFLKYVKVDETDVMELISKHLEELSYVE